MTDSCWTHLLLVLSLSLLLSSPWISSPLLWSRQVSSTPLRLSKLPAHVIESTTHLHNTLLHSSLSVVLSIRTFLSLQNSSSQSLQLLLGFLTRLSSLLLFLLVPLRRNCPQPLEHHLPHSSSGSSPILVVERVQPSILHFTFLFPKLFLLLERCCPKPKLTELHLFSLSLRLVFRQKIGPPQIPLVASVPSLFQ